jgi:hypothetical protein
MDSPFIKIGLWRSAAPRARKSRVAPLRSMVAFVAGQVLLFWPPYRNGKDCDCCQFGGPTPDQNEPSN